MYSVPVQLKSICRRIQAHIQPPPMHINPGSKLKDFCEKTLPYAFQDETRHCRPFKVLIQFPKRWKSDNKSVGIDCEKGTSQPTSSDARLLRGNVKIPVNHLLLPIALFEPFICLLEMTTFKLQNVTLANMFSSLQQVKRCNRSPIPSPHSTDSDARSSAPNALLPRQARFLPTVPSPQQFSFAPAYPKPRTRRPSFALWPLSQSPSA